MHGSHWTRGALALAAGTLPLAATLPVHAATGAARRDAAAVFVQTNDPARNSIVVYDRREDGKLRLDAVYYTHGKGGRAQGASSDPLASQGSLVFDAVHSLLFSVNAGSDSISVFGVRGDELDLRQVISSNGEFPVSLTVHGATVVVLNAGGAANVSGFRIRGGRLQAIPGDTRTLGLTENDPPNFLASPAQVGFTPDGNQLLVTGKTNNFIDVFRSDSDGRLSSSLVQTPDGSVPFAFTFSPADQLDLVNAAGNLAPSRVKRDGGVTPAGPAVSDGQTAACWIATSGDLAFVANTGSNDVSEYRIGDHGHVRLINATAATGVPGAIDEATAGDRFLYVQSGLSSTVKVFAIEGRGLVLLQTAPVPGGTDQEGIVAMAS